MKSPQTEDGFTRIANELYEAIIAYHCSGTQKDIIHAVIRATYGFHMKSRAIGTAYLAKLTRRHPRQVSSDVRKLIQANVLVVVQEHGFTTPRTIALNKDYSAWKGTSRITQSEWIHSQDMSQATHPPLSGTAPIIKIKKDTLKDSLVRDAELVYEYYLGQVNSVNNDKQHTIRSIVTLLRNGKTAGILKDSVDRYARNGMNQERKYRFRSHNFFGRAARYSNYLSDNAESEHLTEQTLHQDVVAELVSDGYESRDHFTRIGASEMFRYRGAKDCLAECKRRKLTKG